METSRLCVQDAIAFDRAADWAKADEVCTAPPEAIEFEDATLAVPTPEEKWVISIAEEVASAEDSEHDHADDTIGVFRTSNDELVTLSEGELNGSKAAVAEAVSAGFDDSEKLLADTAKARQAAVKRSKPSMLEKLASKGESTGATLNISDLERDDATLGDGSPSDKCSTNATYWHKYQGMKSGWNGAYYEFDWYYRSVGAPTVYTHDQYRNRMTQAMDTWEFVDSSCTLNSDALPNFWANYKGASSYDPGDAMQCGSSKPHNVVSWSPGPNMNVLGRACMYGNYNFGILINSWYSWYAASSETGCTGNRYDLGALMVHEFGHVLGLGHVDTYNQVMKSTLAKCASYQRHLGRGDVRGIRAIYGNW